MAYQSFSSISEAADKVSFLAASNRPFLFAIDYECKECIIVENPLQQREILFSVAGVSNVIKSQQPCPLGQHLTAYPESLETYMRRFEIIQNGLRRGDSFVANLTLRTSVETSLSLYEIFMATDASYSLYVPGRFVCFSPECFVTISSEGEIATHPMKGTIAADIPDARNVILNDIKECAEHATVVDLLRNDLSIYAEHVTVERYRYLSELQTDKGDILQVSSEIKGNLTKDWRHHLGKIITSMLPAGSISGAPKFKTTELLRKAEGMERGFYTGIFGYYDGKQLDSGVIIRYVEQDSCGNKYYRSGGGITAKSNVKREYDEIIEKIYLPFRKPTFTEVICIKDGCPQNLDYHIKRLENTMWYFYHIKSEFPRLDVPEGMTGIVKCRIVYDNKIREISYAPYERKLRKTVSLIHDDDINYQYKSTDRSRLTRLLKEAGTDDVIIVRKGAVTDSSYCNLVFEDADGNLFTPSDALLRGTCRQRLLDKGTIREKTIRQANLHEYEYVYFINAMMGLDDAQKFRLADVIYL
ncbi:MAG: aminodeoxychorismate synthase component I [Bacteroidaceae bacterium]|nr:aminodeoxychorismate synthase component I [Bacteroidaceae bacterium]